MRLKITNPVARFVVIAGVVVALFWMALQAFGTDINKGYAFTPTDRVTNTKLNNLVDLASINTDFIHLQTAIAPAAADELLLYSSSSALFRKATVGTFFLNNTNLIVGQTEDIAPGTNDFFLTYDTSAGTLKKVALYNGIPSGFNTMVIPPDINFQMLIRSNGVTYWSVMTNLYQQVYRFYQLANNSNSVSDPTNYFLSANTAPKATDSFLLWSGNTNKYTTLAGLITNLPSAGSPVDGDLLFSFNSSTAQPKKMTVSQLSFKVYNDYVAGITYTKFTTNGIPLGANTGQIFNGLHGLAGIPQLVRWVLVCTNSSGDAGWGQNREVPVEAFFKSANGTPWYSTEVDSSAMFLVGASTGTMQTRHAVSGIETNATPSSWNVKVYAIYHP